MTSQEEESINIRYRNGEEFSVTIIARGVDAATLSCILSAVLETNYQYVQKLKDSFNFECIVIDHGSETIIRKNPQP